MSLEIAAQGIVAFVLFITFLSYWPSFIDWLEAREARKQYASVETCTECDLYPAEWPLTTCPGCQAYREHTA